MNSVDINLMKDFRRFVNTYIYPTTGHIIMCDLKDVCEANDILYNSHPQTMIKFHTDIQTQNDLTFVIYGILKNTFIKFFNNPNVASLIKNKIHTEIQDEESKASLRKTFQEIQYGNPQYLGLLFNITCISDNYVYLYL